MTDDLKKEVSPKSGRPGLPRRIFYSSQGLRVIWRVLLFIAMYVFLDWALDVLLDRIAWLSMKEPTLPSFALIREFFELLVVFFTIYITSRIERRPLVSYRYIAGDKLK